MATEIPMQDLVNLEGDEPNHHNHPTDPRATIFTDSPFVNTTVHDITLGLVQDTTTTLALHLAAPTQDGFPRFSEEGLWAIFQGLMVNTSLTLLSVAPGSLTPPEIPAVFTERILRALCIALLKHPSIQTLDLSNLQLPFAAGVGLARVLLRSTSLKTINLSGNLLGARGFSALSKALPYSTSLESLDLSFNGIDSSLNGDEVGKSLSRAQALKNLSLTGNPIGDYAISCMFKPCLVTAFPLEHLTLNSTEAADKTATVLGELILRTPSLSSVSLNRNSITDFGARYLAGAIPSSKLASLSLESNLLTKAFGSVLGQALASPSGNLTFLSLADNKIGREGLQGMAAGLARNGSLTHIDFSRNEIGDEGFLALLPSFSKNNFHAIHVSGNGISDEVVSPLSQYLPGSSVTAIDFSNNKFTGVAAGVLADKLSKTSLNWINLDANDIDNEGARLLMKAVRNLMFDGAESSRRQVFIHLAGNAVTDSLREAVLNPFINEPKEKFPVTEIQYIAPEKGSGLALKEKSSQDGVIPERPLHEIAN